MENLGNKIDLLLQDLNFYFESTCLSDSERYFLQDQIDKLLYECLYYKYKLSKITD